MMQNIEIDELYTLLVCKLTEEYRAFRYANILRRFALFLSFYGLIDYETENINLINQFSNLFTIDMLMKFIYVTCQLNAIHASQS